LVTLVNRRTIIVSLNLKCREVQWSRSNYYSLWVATNIKNLSKCSWNQYRKEFLLSVTLLLTVLNVQNRKKYYASKHRRTEICLLFSYLNFERFLYYKNIKRWKDFRSFLIIKCYFHKLYYSLKTRKNNQCLCLFC
jgi:hypothetical protein